MRNILQYAKLCVYYQELAGEVRDSYKRPQNRLPFRSMGPKRRKLMEPSWAGLFREHILQELPINKIAPYFTEGFGRPTKELYMALGVIILQQSLDLTDDETFCQLAFSEQ